MNQNQLLREALQIAAKHLVMDAFELSYPEEADLIRAALAQPAESALERYKRLEVDAEETSPVERLRAFCSFAMDGQDWLDVEPFFDVLTAQPAEGGEVVAKEFDVKCDDCDGSGLDRTNGNYKCSSCKGIGYISRKLYTTPPASQEQAAAALMSCGTAVRNVYEAYEAGKKATQEQAQQPQAQAQESPELPEHIGEIVGTRHTPTDTSEFWGYFVDGFKTDIKQRVYTADQMRDYARAALAAKQERKPVTGPVTHGFGDVRPHVEHDFPDCAVFKNGKCTCFATNKRKF